MELNDFQYNWYLHFEEENEKSIVGLPFDPYFEAGKFDEEEVLKFVQKARSLRQLRTRWVSDFTTLYNKIESRWEAFKKKHELFEWLAFGFFIIVLAIPLITGLMGNNLYYFSEAFDFKPLFCDDTRSYISHKYHDHVGIMGRIGYVIWNYIVAGITIYLSMFPFVFFVVVPLAILRDLFGVEIEPNRRDFALLVTILLCTTSAPKAEAVTVNNVHEIETVQLLSDQPTAEQLCSIVEQQGHNWSFKYELKGEKVYLVESHRNGKLANPVLLDNIESLLIVKDIHTECMQKFE